MFHSENAIVLSMKRMILRIFSTWQRVNQYIWRSGGVAEFRLVRLPINDDNIFESYQGDHPGSTVHSNEKT